MDDELILYVCVCVCVFIYKKQTNHISRKSHNVLDIDCHIDIIDIHELMNTNVVVFLLSSFENKKQFQSANFSIIHQNLTEKENSTKIMYDDDDDDDDVSQNLIRTVTDSNNNNNNNNNNKQITTTTTKYFDIFDFLYVVFFCFVYMINKDAETFQNNSILQPNTHTHTHRTHTYDDMKSIVSFLF